MNATFIKSLVATAAMALVAGAAQAANTSPGDIITIQEGAIAGTLPNQIKADQIQGGYDETVTIGASGTTFVSSGYFSAGGWYLQTQKVGSQLGYMIGNTDTNGYNLYAKFVTSGTISVATDGSTQFTVTGGRLEVWADASMNTKYNVNNVSTGNVNTDLTLTAGSNASEDRLLGFATVVDQTISNGNSRPGSGANGNFDITFTNFTLTTATDGGTDGNGYFIAPRPFDVMIDLNGNFRDFPVTAGLSTTITNSSANAYFLPNSTVPEPGSLALVGGALLGAGAVIRRKNRKN